MTARNYDFILNVAGTTNFVESNLIIGTTSKTTALIVNVDHAASTIKVKLANAYQEFTVGETIRSNASILIEESASVIYTNGSTTIVNGNAYSISGTANTFSLPVSSLTNFYKDSIDVYLNDFLLPKQMWVYPAATALGNYGITIKPLHYTKIVESDIANLQVKASEAIKDNFYTPTQWNPTVSTETYSTGSDYASAIAANYSNIIPTADLVGIFVGNQGDAINKTPYNYKLPTGNTQKLEIKISYGSPNSAPFFPGYKISEVVTATTSISSITFSSFTASKNAFEQKPVVRLYKLYYPGEWYPARNSGNPNSSDNDVQYPWPYGFPVKFAEVRGDYISDITYRVQFGGEEYTPYPINSTGISLDSTGKINDVTFVVSNFDGTITSLIESAYLCGYNSSNNISGIVNGETVFNIDSRTNPSNVHYNSTYADSVGINVAWTYESTRAMGDTWIPLKQDTRDLLGGVIEIKTTFADLLDFWPEYSSVIEKTNGNYLKVRTISPYRVGDIIHNDANNMNNAVSVVTQLVPPYLVVNNAIHLNPGDNLYIQNPDASSDEFVLDRFKINNLEGLDDSAARFSLTSVLQYFKNVITKRTFLKNSCTWLYGGDECQYPRSGTGVIPGTDLTANGFFTINNISTADPLQDKCAKNEVACSLRRNEIHFGGFTTTGTSLPR